MNLMNGTVYVVDDDPAVLQAVSRLLRARGLVVHAFQSARAFLEQHNTAAPGCLVLDVVMPDFDGLELQSALVAAGAERMIVFLTGRGDVRTGIRAMRAGAINFLVKPVDDEDLFTAVQEALDKDWEARSARTETTFAQSRLATLTPREREVLAHVVAGQLNKQIASDLGTVEKTVKVHRARVMRKMGVQSLAELVRLAYRCGIGVSSGEAAGLDQGPIPHS
jgi:FixJ family two-component response regulator